jgi:prepilin signal peptidase PulO-like enzyme (type II secretory pathway)
MIFTASKGTWMGFGDVKLALFLGLFLGYPGILVALFSSFILGAIIGSVVVLLKKKKMRSEIPFAPFLVSGTILAFFWGGSMLEWYLNILLINV